VPISIYYTKAAPFVIGKSISEEIKAHWLITWFVALTKPMQRHLIYQNQI